MVEKLEAGAGDGAEYYMVTVSESVAFSYPVLATDAEAAREKVAALTIYKINAANGVYPLEGDRKSTRLNSSH